MIQTVARERSVNSVSPAATCASSSSDSSFDAKNGLLPPPPASNGFGGKGYTVAATLTLIQNGKANLPLYTWEEVASHNSRSSIWVSVRENVYDVTEFINTHPGGPNALLLAAGRDITELLVSYHPFSGNKPTEILQSYHIGYLKTSEFPFFPPDSGFYGELRVRVADYFRTSKLDYKDVSPGLIRLAFILSVAFASFLIYIQPTLPFLVKFVFAIVFGMFQALPLLHAMHDSSHHAISHSHYMWSFIGKLTMDYFAGASLTSWLHQHVVGHHLYTNIPGVDPDLPVRRTGDPRRVTREQTFMPLYRFQHIYLPILYGVLAIKFRVQDVLDTLITHTNGAIRVNLSPSDFVQQLISKSFWFCWRVLLPIYLYPTLYSHQFASYMFLFLVAEFTTGYYLTFNFQVSHVVPSAVFPSLSNIVSFDDEWAHIQMKTTVEYAHQSKLATFLCGALNFQTVHHLFPAVSQYHYPQLAPIVASVAAKYNLPYVVVPSFWQAFYLHFLHLKNMGFDCSDLHLH